MADGSSMADGSLLTARDVARRFGSGPHAVEALRGVDLDVPAGSFVVLRGRSGSGKTTLLNVLGGLDRPDRGTVHFDHEDLLTLPEARLTDLRRRRFGFVFQTFALLPVFSAAENVEIALRLAGAGWRERRERTLELLARVGLAGKENHRPFELSGGERQRVAIARALANRPALIFADEPTGQLDSVTGLAILQLFRDVCRRDGAAVLMATHDPAASDVADVSYQIVDGVVTQV